ncbi:MAG: hypothetical protein M9911_14840 [Saprospiraceae bacterium]|nr:hypothetical protein [Saprospiraceae bacterium]
MSVIKKRVFRVQRNVGKRELYLNVLSDLKKKLCVTLRKTLRDIAVKMNHKVSQSAAQSFAKSLRSEKHWAAKQ